MTLIALLVSLAPVQAGQHPFLSTRQPSQRGALVTRPFPRALRRWLLLGATASALVQAPAAPPMLSVSHTAPVRLSWPTNCPGFSLQTKTSASPAVAWEESALKPVVVGTNYVVTNTFTEPVRLFRLSNYPQLICLNNLRRLGIAFRVWAMDNEDRYPFQVPAQYGGTLELCAREPDGFDANSWAHLMALSNEVANVAVLVCPSDLVREPAASFEQLGPANVSYRLRTGEGVGEVYPDAVLAVCPMDGNTLYCSGAATNGITY